MVIILKVIIEIIKECAILDICDDGCTAVETKDTPTVSYSSRFDKQGIFNDWI